MGWKWVSGGLAALAVLSAVLFSPVHSALADMIGTSPVAESGRGADEAAKNAAVAQSLRQAGLSPTEVDARLGQMTQQDLAVVAENPDQVQMAGSHLAIIILGCLIIIAILYISFG